MQQNRFYNGIVSEIKLFKNNVNSKFPIWSVRLYKTNLN